MKSIATVALLFVTLLATGQDKPYYSSKDGAIKGYDPVAYFTESTAVKGNESYSLEWGQATWYFSSADNKTLFESDPEKYAPQYGGYCAYAVSQGYTAKIDPTAWKIVDGKLYLNYNQKIKVDWEANQTNYIKAADENWPKLKAN